MVLGAIILLKLYSVSFLHAPQDIVLPTSAHQRGPSTLKSKYLACPLTAGREVEKIVMHAGTHNGMFRLETKNYFYFIVQ